MGPLSYLGFFFRKKNRIYRQFLAKIALFSKSAFKLFDFFSNCYIFYLLVNDFKWVKMYVDSKF